MKTLYDATKRFVIPRYEENAALQLVAFTGITFIMFHFARVLLLVFGHDKTEVFDLMFPNIGLSTIELFKHKWWTIFTYGLTHHGFWDWFTNMIWTYSFAAMLQHAIGYRQVIPLFIYGLLSGGIAYLVSQFLLPGFFTPGAHQFIMGCYAGISAIAITLLVIAPQQRFYFSENFSIPFYAILIVYFLLTAISYYQTSKGILALSLGGSIMGCCFAFLLKNGYNPATWVYTFIDSVQKKIIPREDEAKRKRELAKRKELLQNYYAPTDDISQERIDELLDKINEKGYYSLTREEKEALKKAGK